MRRARLALCTAWWVALSLLALPGCGEAPKGRVLVIGLDGATLRVARPLMQAGRLPNLARIAEAGVYGPLRSRLPLSSPRIWTSIATGKLPEKHGILGFAREVEGEQRLYTSADRRTHALWNIASQAGLTVAVVNWWNTYPLERVRGVVVSDHLVPMEVTGRSNLTGAAAETGGSIVYPPGREARVRALLDDRTPLTDVPDPFLDRDAFAPWVRPERLTSRYWQDNAVARIALELERETRPDLMLVFLPGIDRVSHVIWGALEPQAAYPLGLRLTPPQQQATAEALHRYYEYADALVGALVAPYAEDDLVLVVSDHGFERGRGFMFLTGVHESPAARDGVVFARGRDVRSPDVAQPVGIEDVTPTVLAWLGLPVGRDMDGRPAPFLASRRFDRIATWDTQPIERLAETPSGAEEEILDQLEALGYLEHGDAS